MSGGRRPPRAATWALSRILPRDRRGRSILGDLIEEWHLRDPGPTRTAWYVVECLRLALRYLPVRRRLPGTRPPGGGGRGRRPFVSLERVADDVRRALRGLHRQPAFTVTAVAVLALGIAAATAIFTAFRAVVVEDLPVADPGRLVHASLATREGQEVTLSPEEIRVLAREARTLRAAAGVAAFGAEAFPLSEDGRSPSWRCPASRRTSSRSSASGPPSGACSDLATTMREPTR